MNKLNNRPAADCARQIEEDNNLLAMPAAVVKILELAGKEDVSIDKLSEIISTDAALTGRLLKIANSPFYGLSNRITSVQQATMVLGITTVKCLALSAAIFDPAILSSNSCLVFRPVDRPASQRRYGVGCTRRDRGAECRPHADQQISLPLGHELAGSHG